VKLLQSLIAIVPLALLASSDSLASAAADLREAWTADAAYQPRAMRAGAGFSFLYNRRVVGPEFGLGWEQGVTGGASGARVLVLKHDTGLVITREMRVLPEFGAVEYRLRFKNAAAHRLPPISGIQALDLSLDVPASDDLCVVSGGGGRADGFLPPRNFAMRKNCFAPTAPTGGIVQLGTEGGRSSDKDLPFFFVQNETMRDGLFVAFGWSGQWEVFISLAAAPRMLSLKGRIPGLDIALEPGEEIDGPTVLIGAYKGTADEGSNALRRLVRDTYTPKIGGQKVLPMATYDHFFNIEEEFDEPMLRRLVDGAAAINQEYFLLDAGWYAHPNKKEGGWVAGAGNWDEVNKTKFPNGLKPFADSVRSKGLKFGLWFEPERVARGSRLAKEHPEWVLWDHGNDPDAPALGFIRYLPPDHPYSKVASGLLDFGRPEVQEWVKNLMDRYIREFGVRYIRYDFNLEPLAFWTANDTPGRRGMTQLRHIHGFYSIMDWLLQHHPDVVFEGCATGGRRIDLETARRFHTFWISDHTFDPAIIRFHLFGINHFLPGNYHYVAYTLPVPAHVNYEPDDLGFQSLFGGAFGTSGHVDLWSEQMKRQARLHVESWKKLRRYLVEDYYSLSDQPGDLQSWSGWQFQDPKDHSGFIQTFRTRASDSTHRFMLRNLDKDARYRFTDVYGTDSFELAGSKAMMEGIDITQAPMSSRVLTYRRVSTAVDSGF